jgi:ribosomal protein S18 acetylase RimI-like enzyme
MDNTPHQGEPQLILRPASHEDWPQVAPIVEQTWEDGDYIDENLWQQWTADPTGALIAALLGGDVVGFCKLTNFGPAEWWLEGIRVDPRLRNQGIGRQLTEHMVALFQRRGDGILRLATYSENAVARHLATQAGFRHTNSYRKVTGVGWPGDVSPMRHLRPSNLDMILNYLRRSPMRATNRFIEHYWKLYFLSRERLAEYLATDDAEVIGWRDMDRLHGLIIHMLKPPQGREEEAGRMNIGFLDAPDDTTLAAMLRSLRALAAQRGYERVAWKMPVGAGLERTIDGTSYKSEWEGELMLFELPLRR